MWLYICIYLSIFRLGNSVSQRLLWPGAHWNNQMGYMLYPIDTMNPANWYWEVIQGESYPGTLVYNRHIIAVTLFWARYIVIMVIEQ